MLISGRLFSWHSTYNARHAGVIHRSYMSSIQVITGLSPSESGMRFFLFAGLTPFRSPSGFSREARLSKHTPLRWSTFTFNKAAHVDMISVYVANISYNSASRRSSDKPAYLPHHKVTRRPKADFQQGFRKAVE